MANADLIALIYAVTGTLFLAALFLGFLRTFARVLYYARNKAERPKLLTRDLVVMGGLSISFGLITLIRFLPQDVRIALTTGNVIWALLTTIPAVVAVCCYTWFEYRVIERPVTTP